MAKVGILGGGQLAQLLAHSAYQLGIETICFVADRNCPAARNSKVMVGDINHKADRIKFANAVDLITIENENLALEALQHFAQISQLYPQPEIIHNTQKRSREKKLLSDAGIAIAPFAIVKQEHELPAAFAKLGAPLILKSDSGGYDGKNQFVVNDYPALKQAFNQLNGWGVVEKKIDFKSEVSLIAARAHDGTIIDYPLLLNHHQQGILRRSQFYADDLTSDLPTNNLQTPNNLQTSDTSLKSSHSNLRHSNHPQLPSGSQLPNESQPPNQPPNIAPSAANYQLQQKAQNITHKILNTTKYVGVIAVEFFVLANNDLLVNEIAPRVHNSGHLTIEATSCSQFESHLRAICGWQLKQPQITSKPVMLNIIGKWPQISAKLAHPIWHCYNYGKAPRPARKLGHLICSQKSAEQLQQKI